jgi:hypothetical protein
MSLYGQCQVPDTGTIAPMPLSVLGQIPHAN